MRQVAILALGVFALYIAVVTAPDANQNIQAVRPRMQILKLSAKTGEGMQEFLNYLQKLQRSRAQTASAV